MCREVTVILSASMWTGLNSLQKEEIDVFAQHPKVQRGAADGLDQPTVE